MFRKSGLLQGSFIQADPLSDALSFFIQDNGESESSALSTYQRQRTMEHCKSVSFNTFTALLLAWLMQEADDIHLFLSDRCVGSAVQDEGGIPENTACMHQHVKRVLFR